MPLWNNISPLTLARGGAVAALTYLLREEWAADESAPMTSPRTCAPGPGTLVAGTPANMSVSSGTLNITATGAAGQVGWKTTAQTRAAGLTFSARVTSNAAAYFGPLVGWNKSNNYNLPAGSLSFYMRASGAIGIYPDETNVLVILNDTHAHNTYDNVIIIQRSAGALYVLNNTLVWVSDVGSSNCYAVIAAAGILNDVTRSDWERIYQMGAPYNDDYGIATNRVASPSAGEATTSEANAIIEMTWQAVTGETWELSTRRTDDDNRWIVRCAQSGTIKLIQKQGGTETERSSASQTWTNGTSYRVVIVQTGNTIKTHVANVVKNTYTSATFNNTATGVKTDKAGVNLITWPRDLSGAALTELQRWLA